MKKSETPVKKPNLSSEPTVTLAKEMSSFLSYKNVGVSETEIWEASKGRIVERRLRSELINCRLERGSPEQRPMMSAMLGGILAIPGGLFVQHTFVFFSEGYGGNIRYEATMLILGLLGGWLLFQSFIQKRYYLRISTRSVTRKLIFAADTGLDGIRDFLKQAAIEYDLEVDDAQKSEAI